MTNIITRAEPASLAIHEKNIQFYAKGARQGAAELYGYSALAGREMLLAKPLIPHGNNDPDGGFKHWLEERFPHIAYCTATRWMRFYEAIQEKGCMMQLFSNAAPKLLGNGELSEKDCDIVLDAVPQIMDGKSATAFMRDLKLARDPEKAGGFRPDAKAVEKWLKANHPDLAGTKFNDLPKPIQAAFKKQYKPDIDPEAIAEATRERWRSLAIDLAREHDASTHAQVFHTDDPAHVDFVADLRETLFHLHKNLGLWLKGAPKKKKSRKRKERSK